MYRNKHRFCPRCGNQVLSMIVARTPIVIEKIECNTCSWSKTTEIEKPKKSKLIPILTTLLIVAIIISIILVIIEV